MNTESDVGCITYRQYACAWLGELINASSHCKFSDK